MMVLNNIRLLMLVYFFAYTYVEAQPRIIINEIMVNPTNAQLPNYEYIELFNTSDQVFDIANLRLHVNNNSVVLPSYFLSPRQFVVLCPQAAQSYLSSYGNVISPSSWHVLNNTSATLMLSYNGAVMDELSYTTAWYGSSSKRNGGWSLERINPDLSCNNASTWTASIAPVGGTPCQTNSVANRSYSPALTISSATLDEQSIVLTFNASTFLESLTAQHFQIQPDAISPLWISWNAQKDSLTLQLPQPLDRDRLYTLSSTDIRWCNTTTAIADVTLFSPSTIGYNTILINEVLFNPRAGGVDFVELYNYSSKPINLKDWRLGNRLITDQTYILYPQEHLAITTDPNITASHYPSSHIHNMLAISSLPAYANQQGTVTLYEANGTLVDSLYYNASMHQRFLSNVKGISLERQSFMQDTNEPRNFQSASTLSGGATPGYENSTTSEKDTKKDRFFLTSKTVSPNGDLFEDILEINYELSSADHIFNLTIFDDQGRIINRLIRSQTAGITGKITWDCLDENGRLATPGIYIYALEITYKNGDKSTDKGSFVVTQLPQRY